MGKIELDHTGSGSGITLSSDGTDLLLDGTAVGGSPDLYAESYDGTSTKPNAGGTNTIAIGVNAYAVNENSIAFGTNASAQGGTSAVALGDGADARQVTAVAIGYNTYADGSASVALGRDAQARADNAIALGKSRAGAASSIAGAINNNSGSYGTTGVNSVALGTQSRATNNSAASIGQSSIASGYQSAAYGYNAVASGQDSFAGGSTTDATATNSTALGKNAQATHANATAVGYNAATSATNQVALGASGYAVKISDTYTLPTSDGTANQVLTTDGSGAVTFADAPAPLDLYAENPSSPTAPSATGANAIAFGSNANASGSSAFAFGTARAQGASSFAVNLGNTGSLYKAGGTNSIAMGSLARAPDNHAIAIGEGAQTAAANAIALGSGSEASNAYSIALGGRYARTGADYSMATGYWSRSHVIGSKVHASGRFSSWGDAQTGTFVLRSETTDGSSPEEMTTDGNLSSTSNIIILQNNSAFAFHGTIVARQKASQGTASAAWKVEGLIRREGSAGTTVLVNSATTVLDNTPSWGLSLIGDTLYGGLNILVIGAASTNIRWVATIHTSEVTYA